jgi:predicted ester cyclase
MHYTVEALIAEDDKVAVLYTWRGTHTGSLGGLPPTGRTVTATGAIVCRVADGRIVEQWDIDDRLDVMQQLGFIPTPGQPEP